MPKLDLGELKENDLSGKDEDGTTAIAIWIAEMHANLHNHNKPTYLMDKMLVNASGEMSNTSVVLDGKKFLFLLFSSLRNDTEWEYKVIDEFYEECRTLKPIVEVIYVPLDMCDEEFQTALRKYHSKWWAFQLSDRHTIRTLTSCYGVEDWFSIPILFRTIVVAISGGCVVSTNPINDIYKYGLHALKMWS
ncbi:hypothetical protein AAG570_011406 [Ranatra chinensis]|uniref:Uncharacterized protein n=1 Tax=Ranatra chinensis TaxID=642074 RepID=A0ABD0YMQ4_9HEMI